MNASADQPNRSTPSNQQRLTCAVVVCTRKNSPLLERCLLALRRQNPELLILVQNGPFDDSLRRQAGDIGAIYLHEPKLGLSRARNLGLRTASAEIVAFVDDDAEVQPGWLAAITDAFADPGVGCVFGKVIDEGSIDHYTSAAGFEISTPDGAQVRMGCPCWFEQVTMGRIGAGMNFAVRRSLLVAAGGFDERLGLGSRIPGHEEHKAALEILRQGAAARYLSDAVVRHAGGTRPDPVLRRRILDSAAAAAAYLVLLFAEYPELRSEVIRYFRSKVQTSTRERMPGLPVSMRLRLGFSRVRGMGLYLVTRVQNKQGTAPSGERAAHLQDLEVSAELSPSGGVSRHG